MTDQGRPYEGTVDDWMDGLPESPITPPDVYRIRKLLFAGASSRYDTMVHEVGRLVAQGAYGQPVREPIEALFTTYVGLVGDERDAESEFYRALEGAIKKWGSK
jgi:hypothetical protein